jgi:hypothetical protein
MMTHFVADCPCHAAAANISDAESNASLMAVQCGMETAAVHVMWSARAVMTVAVNACAKKDAYCETI